MQIGDYPILEVVIRKLVQHGFDYITLAVNHQGELLRAFFEESFRGMYKLTILKK
jgi:NDP-mannose synthase